VTTTRRGPVKDPKAGDPHQLELSPGDRVSYRPRPHVVGTVVAATGDDALVDWDHRRREDR
jgi:hypothetical protein